MKFLSRKKRGDYPHYDKNVKNSFGNLAPQLNRVLALPKEPAANAMYFVKNGDLADTYFIDKKGKSYLIGSLPVTAFES